MSDTPARPDSPVPGDAASLPPRETPRRRELAAFFLFCLLNVLVPVITVDLFPFSRAPMFADAPRRFCTFKVYAPDGRELPVREFGLHRNYWGNPLGVGCGFHPPESLDQFGTVPDRETIVAHVEEQLVRWPEYPFVDVVREVTGACDARTIGQTEWTRWRIPNPHARPGDEVRQP
jgi:hypothetical protein